MQYFPTFPHFAREGRSILLDKIDQGESMIIVMFKLYIPYTLYR